MVPEVRLYDPYVEEDKLRFLAYENEDLLTEVAVTEHTLTLSTGQIESVEVIRREPDPRAFEESIWQQEAEKVLSRKKKR